MKMRARVQTFIASAALLMAVAPVVNLSRAPAAGTDATSRWKLSVLYNLDFALPWLSRPLYTLGISINPGQVVIGRDGWLYLGDDHAASISAKRLGIDAGVLQTVNVIAQTSQAWQARLQSLGVHDVRVVVWPDKESVYPQALPRWALAAGQSPLDVLAQKLPPSLFVDTRAALRAARTQLDAPLYYQTDTHWNMLGAWLAFKHWADAAPASNVPIRWPAPSSLQSLGTQAADTGDLARLIRLHSPGGDREPRVRFDTEAPVTTLSVDFGSGVELGRGGNGFVAPPAKPMLVHAQGALNQARVLWLRDSFGTAVSPFMAASFSTTLHVHHQGLNAQALESMVRRFKPDHVFVTVVERDVFAVLKALGSSP